MGNFYHHDLFFFSNNCNSFSKRATQIKSNHGKGQIKSTQISNSKNGLFCESIQLSDSRIVDSKQIMAHLCKIGQILSVQCVLYGSLLHDPCEVLLLIDADTGLLRVMSDLFSHQRITVIFVCVSSRYTAINS